MTVKKIFASLAASWVFTAACFAQGVSINLPSTESVNEKIEILRQMGKKSGMEEALKERYDKLWERADRVSKMNDRCGTISLNDVLDQDCQLFYEVELPKFDKEFFELTGDFRLNSVKAVQSLDDKKALINACVDALDPDLFTPSQIFRLSGDISPEPLDNDMVMVKYQLSMDIDEASRTALQEQFSKWYESCKAGIISQDEFAPYFLQKMSRMNPGKFGTFTANEKSVTLALSKESPFNYYINNRFIFANAYHREQSLFQILSNGEISFPETTQMNWKGNIVLRESEVKNKGVSGKLLWGKRLAPKRRLVNLYNRPVKAVEIGDKEWSMDLGKMNWQNAKNVCPAGWRLPTDQDWIDMGTLVKNNNYGHSIAASLKAARGWISGGHQEQGFDFFGFSARPESYGMSETANCSGNCAKYWSATEADSYSASGWVLMGETLKLVPHKKSESLSVRCVKGNGSNMAMTGNASPENVASRNNSQVNATSEYDASGKESNTSKGTIALIAGLAAAAVVAIIFTGKD